MQGRRGRFHAQETRGIGGKGPPESRPQSPKEGAGTVGFPQDTQHVPGTGIEAGRGRLPTRLHHVHWNGDDPIHDARHATGKERHERFGRVRRRFSRRVAAREGPFEPFVRDKVGGIAGDVAYQGGPRTADAGSPTALGVDGTYAMGKTAVPFGMYLHETLDAIQRAHHGGQRNARKPAGNGHLSQGEVLLLPRIAIVVGCGRR